MSNRPESDTREPPHKRSRWPVVAIMAVVMIVAATAFAVLSRSDEPRTALAAVRQGKAAFAAAPAIHGTVLVDHAYIPGLEGRQQSTVEVWHSGRPGTPAESTRLQLLQTDSTDGFSESGPGSFLATTGERTREYRARDRVFSVRFNLQRPGGDAAFFGWPTGGLDMDFERVCRDMESKLYPEDRIAGRPARHVACGDLSGALTRAGFNSSDNPGRAPVYHLWIDQKTGVILKFVGPADGPFYLGLEGSWEFQRIEYERPAPPEIFRPAAPAGARDLSAEREAGLAALARAGSFRAAITEVIEPPTCPSKEFGLGPEECKTLSRQTVRSIVSYRDEKAGRVEVISATKPNALLITGPLLDGAPGSFAVYDGGACRFYAGLERLARTTGITPGEPPARPASGCPWLGVALARLVPGLQANWPNETWGGPPDEKSFGWEEFSRTQCRTAGNERVGGRPARKLACPTRNVKFQQTFWLDDATGLVLKYVAPGRIATQVTRLEPNPSFAPEAFTFSPPTGARVLEKAAADPYMWTQLGEGSKAPNWRAPALGGGVFIELDRLLSRPTLVLIARCAAGDAGCDLLPPLQHAAEKWRDDINVVWVADISFDAPSEAAAQQLVESIVKRNRYTFQIVVDRFGDFGPGDPPTDPVGAAWKLHPPILNETPQANSLYVLLDPDLRVVDAKFGGQSSADLDRMIQKAVR